MTDETDRTPREELELAREKLSETLVHIEEIEGSGIWGLMALVVGLALKGVLWKTGNKIPDEEER